MVPADPLSAQGLATPYQLKAPCHEADDGMSAFVQATIIDPATGAISVYNPLVTDAGSEPAAKPVVPVLPAGAVVGIWFGFNGDNLALAERGGSLRKGVCVNGLGDSIFGQYAYCDAPAFFTAANAAIAAGKVRVPDLGTAKDGLPCPSTRDFGIVDMDQSDNVTTTYLFLPDGTTAQNTAANQALLAARGAKVEVNASDNGLLDNFVSPSLACTPYMAPDLADPDRSVTALALNELQAGAHQAAPIALIPTNDPMSLVDGKTSVRKTNLYRAGVGQPPIDAKVETPAAYCRNLVDVGVSRTVLDRPLTVPTKSPDAGAANNLFTFLAQRLAGSFDELGCDQLLGMRNPVTVVTNADGVAVDAHFAAPAPSRSPSMSPAPSRSPSTAPTSAAPTTAAPSRSAPAVPPTPPAPTQGTNPVATTPPNAAGPKPPAAGHTQPAATAGTARPPATPAGPDVVPAGQPAAAVPAAPGSAPAAMSATDSPEPQPTLTLGPMPVRAGSAGGSAGGGGAGRMPPAKLAGTVMISGAGVLVLGILIRGLVNARRRRYQFARL